MDFLAKFNPLAKKKPKPTEPTGQRDIGYDIHSKRVVWVEKGTLTTALQSCLRGLCFFRTVRCTTGPEAISEVLRGGVAIVVICFRNDQRPDAYSDLVDQIHNHSLAIPIVSVHENTLLDKDFIKNSLRRYTTSNSKVCYVQLGSTYVEVTAPMKAASRFLNRIMYQRHYGTHEVGGGTPFVGERLHQGRVWEGSTSSTFGFPEILIHAREEAIKLCEKPSSYIVTEPPHGDDFHRKLLKERFPPRYPTYLCCEESLALYSTGNTSGLVVTLGWNYIRVVPILDGNPLIDRVRIMSPKKGQSAINLRRKMAECTITQGINEYMGQGRVLSYDKSRSMRKDIANGVVTFTHPGVKERGKFYKETLEKMFSEPVAETWVAMEEFFNTELYQLLSLSPDSETASETLPQFVRNCIETIPNEYRPKVCSTVQLCGSIGWCDGFKQRFNDELFQCTPSPDCTKWADTQSPFDDDANCSLDVAVRQGTESIFVTTGSRGLLCNLSEMKATDIKTGATVPLKRTGLDDLHPFQPHQRYADIPVEVIERIFEFLGPLAVYCTTQSLTTAMEVGDEYGGQASLGVQKLLNDYPVNRIIPSLVSSGTSSDRGLGVLIRRCMEKKTDH